MEHITVQPQGMQVSPDMNERDLHYQTPNHSNWLSFNRTNLLLPDWSQFPMPYRKMSLVQHLHFICSVLMFNLPFPYWAVRCNIARDKGLLCTRALKHILHAFRNCGPSRKFRTGMYPLSQGICWVRTVWCDTCVCTQFSSGSISFIVDMQFLSII